MEQGKGAGERMHGSIKSIKIVQKSMNVEGGKNTIRKINPPAVARVSAPNTKPPSKITPQIVVPVDIGWGCEKPALARNRLRDTLEKFIV